jgi:predicted DCC family thiol-disulfide oxidoreductase YuxK
MPAGFHDLAPAVTAEPGRASEGKNMRATEPEITVFYDGACPRCVRDRAQYERWAGPAGAPVCWFDITGQDERLRALGLDPHRALNELHVLDEHQRLRSELDAYILLVDRVPRLKPLAWLIGQPWVRPWLARLYHWMVNRRLRRSGRLG